jgi:hypothetical protein
MQGTGRAYEKPSWISQGLVVGLSIAVVLTAGRLAITIMFSAHGTTAVVADTARASAPAPAENGPPKPDGPHAARVNWGDFDLFPRDDASPTPARSALPLASFADPPPAAAREPGALSIAKAVPDVDPHSIPAGLPPSSAAEGKAGSSTEATEAIADLLRAPPPPSPPPHSGEGKVGAASIPVPRPRPRLESEDVQPAAPEQSPLDWLIGRQQ